MNLHEGLDKWVFGPGWVVRPGWTHSGALSQRRAGSLGTVESSSESLSGAGKVQRPMDSKQIQGQKTGRFIRATDN